MIDPVLALQDAIGAVLAASPAVLALVPATAILDSTSLPITATQIIIGEGQALDANLSLARDMVRVTLDLHVWVAEDGTAGGKMVAAAIRGAVRGLAPLAIEDHRALDLNLTAARFMRDREGEQPLSHGIVTLSALLQENAP